jgi:glycosyltransferase involved in cell wall biosynthesis
MLGAPIIGLATTESATGSANASSGYIDTDARRLIEVMRDLLRDPEEARRLGEGARRTAERRFNIDRFARDWDDAFALVTGAPMAASAANGNGATAWQDASR